MSLHHMIADRSPEPFPPGFEVTLTHTHPECWPKTYVLCKATGGLLAITGEGDSMTYELEDATRCNVWTTISIFPRFPKHETAVNWLAAALSDGEARERRMEPAA